VNIGSLLWDSETAVFGCEGLLRNNMKEIKVLVVAVVRGVKVDIGDMIVTDAASRAVQALEKRSDRNVPLGMPVQRAAQSPCLSHFFTGDVGAASERAVRNVSKWLRTAPVAEIEQPCLSTVVT
jgi:hypothetical protein